jgi:diguanylate cyclase (GGDEF)-like protein
MRAGADAYFVAPVDTEALVRRLTHLVVPRDASPYRVLVVEDDPSQAKFAATILRKGGMDAKVVTEALDVMDAIQDFKPDLVLMDVYMPDASGVELTRVIRQQSDLVALPIVYLSGEQNPEKQQSALSVGGDDFIAKPIRPKHLLATVSNRIQRARQLRDGLGGGQDEGRLDSATGLSTKSRFFERVDSLVRDRAQDDREGGLLHIALEGVAEIKAQIGPEQADTLVAMAGTRVASALSAGDVATRLGDSSFAVLISHAEVPQIRSLADRLLKAITHMPYEIGNRRLRLRASAGLCPLYQGLSDGAGAASRAAKATRSASQAGGDRVEVYGGEAGGVTTALHRQLRDALESGDTELMLRPIGRLQNDPAESYEVGLRISTGDGRVAIDPRDIRTTAERADMAEETFRWMLDQALSVLEERGGDGRAFRLFLRLSPQFLASQETRAWLRDRLRARHLTGSGLVAELPLTDVAADPKAARELVRSLGELGIGTALSRFTGSDAAFRVLRFLRSDYVELTEAVAQSSQQALTRLAEAVHQTGALVIVPHGADGRREEHTRAAGADLILGQRVQQAHGAYGPGS